MKDVRKYRDGERWTYKHDWFNPRVTESPSRCWKDQRGKGRNKRNTQYRPVVMA